MGRSLGYHDSDELDRPELNKCPDCECFFASDECPLCGKICPEEMRAGNRAKVKPPKKRKNSSGRVQFIDWYHSWWFILLMMYVMPIVGIILFFTSPHSKKSKIIAASAVVGVYILGILLVIFGSGLLSNLFYESPVNDRISREEYVVLCEPMDVESFYRVSGDTGRYVSMELIVVERCVEQSIDVYEADVTYYRCRDLNGGELMVCVLDYNLGTPLRFLPGDMIRVYGESAGRESFVGNPADSTEYPCLYMAYCELIG
ncbi:MAG: hypothetical protein IKM33_03245 [Clostridia bacterium]|nr:hypothetical protein [Clostridia bacterium]